MAIFTTLSGILRPVWLKKTETAAPYAALLYFIELFYVLMVVNIITGRAVTAVLGLTLFVLASLHLVRLQMGYQGNRRIHAWFCTGHCAYSLACIVSWLLFLKDPTWMETFLAAYRGITSLVAIPVILALSSDAEQDGRAPAKSS